MTVYDAEPVAPPSLTTDEKFHRTYTTVYQVFATTDEGPFSVGSAGGLPGYGLSYAFGNDIDLWAFCKNIQVQPNPTRVKHRGAEAYKWLVTVTHSTIPSDHNPGQSRENPLNDPKVISGSFVGYTRPTWRDKNDDPVVNSAKDPYVPPEQVDDAYDTLRISYNTANINLGQRAQFRGSVNSTSIWGLGVRQAKLTRWDYSVQYAGNSLAYIRHDFEFLISWQEHPASADICSGTADAIGWYTTLPNSGYAYYPGGTLTRKNRVPFTSEDQLESTPQKLACDGDEAAPDSDQKYNVFELEIEKDFNTIPGMPNPLPGPFV